MSEEIQGFRFRASTRVPYGEKVRLRFDRSEGSLVTVCSDLSVEGMFVATREVRPLGTVVEFEIEGREDEIARGLGDIVWAREEAAGPGRYAGMGIQFRYVDPISRQLIAEMVARRRREKEAEEAEDAEEEGGAAGHSMEVTVPPGVEVPVDEASSVRAPAAIRRTEDVVLAGRGGEATEAPVGPVALDGEQVDRRRRGFPWIWAILALLLLGAAAVAWWIWFSERPSAVPPIARSTPEPVAGDREAGAVAVAPEASSAPAGPVEVRSLALIEDGGETALIAIELTRVPEGDGVRVSRLEDPPRVLVRIRGAERVPPDSELAIETDLVRGLRAAVHLEGGSSELHLVFDLADEGARAASRVEGQRLLLRLSNG
ncbi:MAG TPA: PilZ domain-containing protein [Thermoanaerobaculia bacterium]|nr:PilZ domain-containing protein [Thermoanaerobaculia bacterium]